MWHELIGRPKYAAGTAGTVTVPAGSLLVSIVVHASAASATVSIFGGANIPVINGAPPTELRFNHTLFQSQNDTNASGSQDIVFTNTDSYFVHYVSPGHAGP